MEPLTLVAVPLSRCYPPLSIDIIQVVSSFLDPSPWLTMKRAAGSGSTLLWDRVLKYLEHHDHLFQCDAVRKSWLVDSIMEAIYANSLAMVQHLHLHHPNRWGMRILEVAQSRDRQEIFVWLLLNRCEYSRWVTREDQEIQDMSRLPLVLDLSKARLVIAPVFGSGCLNRVFRSETHLHMLSWTRSTTTTCHCCNKCTQATRCTLRRLS